MRYVMPIVMAFATVVIATRGIADATAPSSDEAELVVAEGVASSDGLTVTNGNIVMENGRPGIAFAFVTKPGQDKEFTYFLVFAHNFPKGDVESRSKSDGLRASTYHEISSFGNKLKVQYRVALEPQEKVAVSEKTLLADKTFDSSKGKVFLVNMKTSSPRIEQVYAELPSTFPDLRNTDTVARFAAKALYELRDKHKAINAFCKQLEDDN